MKRLLGCDPAGLLWPQEFSLGPPGGTFPAVYDPHNRVVSIVGAGPADIPDFFARQETDQCRRCLVFAHEGNAGAWLAAGFVSEGEIPGYWPDGSTAALWVRGSGGDEVVVKETVAVHTSPTLPDGWICRPALVDDATAITMLLQSVFSDYPVPPDPGVQRYALASGQLHGRVITRPTGKVVAVAAIGLSDAGTAPEVTDCATMPSWRGQGLMTLLVARLQADLEDVFGLRRSFALVRADQPAMQVALVRLGFRQTGCLRGHFLLGRQWVSAAVMTSQKQSQIPG